MRRLIFAAALALSAAAGPSFAASEPAAKPAAEGSASVRQALARRYFAAIHYNELTASMSEKMMPALLDPIAKQNPNLSEKERAAMIEATVEASKAFNLRLGDEVIAVIADTFDEAELKAMVDFYESAVGQSIMRKTPGMIPKMTEIAVREMPSLQADMLKRMCAKLDCAMIKLPATQPG